MNFDPQKLTGPCQGKPWKSGLMRSHSVFLRDIFPQFSSPRATRISLGNLLLSSYPDRERLGFSPAGTSLCKGARWHFISLALKAAGGGWGGKEKPLQRAARPSKVSCDFFLGTLPRTSFSLFFFANEGRDKGRSGFRGGREQSLFSCSVISPK